ncbi:hypothetical protein TrRE_jg7064, partial [Triparma retinervis]
LSHNSFETLEGFENLANLRDLNLNFNRVGSVENLGGLKFLKALYLSNNLMDDVAIRNIRNQTLRGSFASLSTLCLYSNRVSSLPLAMELVSSLPDLEDVAMEGNECSSREGYRQSVIRSGRKIKVLDGEEVRSVFKKIN